MSNKLEQAAIIDDLELGATVNNLETSQTNLNDLVSVEQNKRKYRDAKKDSTVIVT